MILLFFGPPGAGKGTQSEKLSKEKGFFHLSTGDIFRTAIKNETSLGVKAKSYMDEGKLVPDDITIGLVEEKLEDLAGKDIIFDGFPRTLPQANAFDELLEKKDLKIEKALFLDVKEEKLIGRLTGRRVCKSCGTSFHVEFNPPKEEGACDKCGGELKQRSDDSEDAIKTRLKAYKDSTYPLIEYYKEKGLFASIDGEGNADEVFKRILEEIPGKK